MVLEHKGGAGGRGQATWKDCYLLHRVDFHTSFVNEATHSLENIKPTLAFLSLSRTHTRSTQMPCIAKMHLFP